MNLVGHADFETTRRFYLAVREYLLQRAREASMEAMSGHFVTRLFRGPEKKKAAKHKCLTTKDLLIIPGATRTHNLWLRRPTLYPIELRGQKL